MVRQQWESTVLLYLCAFDSSMKCVELVASRFSSGVGGGVGVGVHTCPVYNPWPPALLSLGL